MLLPTPHLLCSSQLFYYKIKVEILLHIREYTLPIQSCSKNNLNSHTFRHHLAPVSIQADQTPRHKEGCPETERQKHSKHFGTNQEKGRHHSKSHTHTASTFHCHRNNFYNAPHIMYHMPKFKINITNIKNCH